MHNYIDVIKNLESIYSTNSSMAMLKDFERVLDELNLYVYKNWIKGELIRGPKIERHWVECTFMWPKEKMPDPMGGKMLLDYGCKVKFHKSEITVVRKIKNPDDIRPGTKKGKFDQKPIWAVTIRMPKKLIEDISESYMNEKRKIMEPIKSGPATPAGTQPVDQATAGVPAAGAAVPGAAPGAAPTPGAPA
jgi:hypothetical protein